MRFARVIARRSEEEVSSLVLAQNACSHKIIIGQLTDQFSFGAVQVQIHIPIALGHPNELLTVYPIGGMFRLGPFIIAHAQQGFSSLAIFGVKGHYIIVILGAIDDGQKNSLAIGGPAEVGQILIVLQPVGIEVDWLFAALAVDAHFGIFRSLTSHWIFDLVEGSGCRGDV